MVYLTYLMRKQLQGNSGTSQDDRNTSDSQEAVRAGVLRTQRAQAKTNELWTGASRPTYSAQSMAGTSTGENTSRGRERRRLPLPDTYAGLPNQNARPKEERLTHRKDFAKQASKRKGSRAPEGGEAAPGRARLRMTKGQRQKRQKMKEMGFEPMPRRTSDCCINLKLAS